METRQALQLLNGFCSLLFLYYASIQIPVAGVMVSALMPFPTIIMGRRCGLLAALMVVMGVMGGILGLEQLLGIKAEIVPFAEMALIGLLLTFLDSRGYAVELVIGLTVISLALIGSLFFFWQGLKQGLSPLVYLNQTIQDVLNNLASFLQKEGLSLKDLLPGEVSLPKLGNLLLLISPSLLVMNTTVVVWLNLILSRQVLRQTITVNGDAQAPLNRWEAPGWLVFIFLGGGFMMFVPSKWFIGLGLNILLISSLIYLLQGLAIVSFTFQRYQVPMFIRGMAYFLPILLKPVLLMTMILGLADLWVDFRRLHQPPAEAQE